MSPRIERTETVEFSYRLNDVGTPPGGFDVVYDPGNVMERELFGIRIHVDDGHVGTYVGSNSPGAAQINVVAPYLVGREPLAPGRISSMDPAGETHRVLERVIPDGVR